MSDWARSPRGNPSGMGTGTGSGAGGDDRMALVDGLKAGACLLIVLHHLVFYGPMADHAAALFPVVFGWLGDQARLAVQVFLVLGGWLAVRSWRRQALQGREVAQRVLQRYLRLAVPLWAALALAIVANAVADHWMDHHSIGSAPELAQVVAHVLLLQDLAGHEALSAGVWYVAIDFQLHAMLTLLLAWAAQRARPARALAMASLALLALSGLLVNRHADWDVAAPYFWVSYGLGVLVALSGPGHSDEVPPWVLPAAAAVIALALLVEFRWRLVVAGLTALLLWGWSRQGWPGLRLQAWIPGLSRISYAVFLTHFPISLMVNAWWSAHVPPQPGLQLVGVLLALKLSLLGGWAFHEAVERWVWPAVRRVERAVVRRFSANAA